MKDWFFVLNWVTVLYVDMFFYLGNFIKNTDMPQSSNTSEYGIN